MKHHLIVLVLLAGMALSCGGAENDANKEEGVETVLPADANVVAVMDLKLSDFNRELISNGKLTARKYAELKFESAEPIASIYVRNGDRVAKGQKLAELSTFRLSNRTAQAKDALERAQLELQDVLIGQGYRLEDSLKVPPSTMQLVKIRSGYDQAKIQYDLAVYEENRAVLTAPFDGVVANLSARPFNTASTSEAFCSVIDQGSLEASFTLLESELPMIQKGDRVQVSPFSSSDVRVDGSVSEINPFVDAKGMVQVKAVIPANGSFFEGMNVRVSVQRLIPGQLVVPKEAVVLRSGKQVVFTLVNEQAYWNYIQTELENSASYTVVEGLKDGDIVITEGNINLAHEAPVTVK